MARRPPPYEVFFTASFDGNRLELACDVPDQGSGVEGYIGIVADLVQNRYGGRGPYGLRVLVVEKG